MPLDFGNIGKNLGDLAKTAKEAYDQHATPPPQPAPVIPAAAATPLPTSPAPMDQNTVHGSATLRHRALMPLNPALDLNSSSIIMGSDDLNGSLGFVWDLKKLPGHAMTFGPTRKGGKGVSAIIPALLTYTAGSRLCIDPKGENYFGTKDRALAAGHRVVLMDPWNEANRRYGSKIGVSEPVTKYNPLASLDPASPDFSDEVSHVADAVIMVPDTANRHFDESAREFVAGCVAAVVESSPGTASMRDVRELITLDDAELSKRLEEIVTRNPHSLAARKLRRFTKANNEVASVRATAETQTAFLDSETLLDSMETDAPPFDLSELATGKVSLYLVLPVDRLETHGRWMRLILTLAIRAIARQDTPPANPVMFLLDEMGTIGRLTVIETAFGLMAGLGIRLWGFLQDLTQLQGLYPKTWETFISNSSVVQILKAHDGTTSEYVSRYLGEGTVNAKTGGRSLKTKPYAHPDEYDSMVIRESVRFMVKAHDSNENRSRELITALRRGDKAAFKGYDQAALDKAIGSISSAITALNNTGYTQQGHTDWSDDEQLIGRPLLNPDEVRRLPDEHLLLLVPGSDPFIQFRTIYYKHPLFAEKFRANPYFKGGK